ncbi:MAG: class I SAM-dependent methyltransferase [Gemmataceae bacterium]|nr:class I SAM-dependent methyltransferase [Gemmataceae bacterium]MDW8265850.1 class I SAM-dependent methyltransferase [Gemmataceae bacterium]
MSPGSDAAEQRGCRLCGGPQGRTVVRCNFNLTGRTARRYRVCECGRCGFRWVDPWPTEAELAACYAADYPGYAGASRRQAAAVRSAARRSQQVARYRRRLLRTLGVGEVAGRRILDVGYGNGAFLLELARQPFTEPWGLDITSDCEAELRRQAPQVRLVRGTLADAELPAEAFDVVTLWHVLEHTADPVAALRRVRDLLRPGGWVVAEVPNSAGLIARLCGSAWLGWDLPRHLVHFGPGTLRAVARRAGYEAVRVVRAYSLEPLSLSPLLASLAMAGQRLRGRPRMKRVAYHRWDGPVRLGLAGVNLLERLLGGNGLVLLGHKRRRGGSAAGRPPAA